MNKHIFQNVCSLNIQLHFYRWWASVLNYTALMFHQLLNYRIISTSNHTGRSGSRRAKNYKCQLQEHHLMLMQPWDAFAILTFPTTQVLDIVVGVFLYLKINFLIMSTELINFSFKFNFINSISRGSVNIRSLALQIQSLQRIQNRIDTQTSISLPFFSLSVFVKSWLRDLLLLTSVSIIIIINVIIGIWTGADRVHVFSPSTDHTLPAVVFSEVFFHLSFLTLPVRHRPCVLCGP